VLSCSKGNQQSSRGCQILIRSSLELPVGTLADASRLELEGITVSRSARMRATHGAAALSCTSKHTLLTSTRWASAAMRSPVSRTSQVLTSLGRQSGSFSAQLPG
jgi:hypothetical protein